MSKPRPLDEWHEDMGPKLWWRFPIEEPPYCGSPLDCGHAIGVVVRHFGKSDDGKACPVVEREYRHYVGAWPGYHTHFTDIPYPDEV